MSRLLYIPSSPRQSRSASRTVAAKFLETYLESHPHDEIETIDLWKYPLPEISGFLLEAAYAVKHGQTPSREQEDAWQAVAALAERFKSADKYLLSLPMWNFSIPYKLKHFIDLLVHSGLTYSFTPEDGYKGLVTGKPLAVIYARGGVYRPGTPWESLDSQSSYVKQVFGFIGFTEFLEIMVEPTAMGADAREAAIGAAILDVVDVARSF